MMDGGKTLDAHELRNPNATGHAHATEVITFEIDEHEMLGALLGIGA